MEIKIKDFQGPLDLLLHLVSKYQLDIYDVPLVDVIEQYLAFIKTMQTLQLEVAGDYMVMASQLMVIKSRKLLPKPRLISDEPEDVLEEELFSQLEDYRRFKELSVAIAKKHDQRAVYFSKPKTELMPETSNLIHDKTSLDLFLAFSTAMTKYQERTEPLKTTITAEQFTIDDMMQRIILKLEEQNALTLELLFEEAEDKEALITLFLALLELLKRQMLAIDDTQDTVIRRSLKETSHAIAIND